MRRLGIPVIYPQKDMTRTIYFKNGASMKIDEGGRRTYTPTEQTQQRLRKIQEQASKLKQIPSEERIRGHNQLKKLLRFNTCEAGDKFIDAIFRGKGI